MTWENEMVKLVQKLSKEVKSSPNYHERKMQMLQEHREYMKQEKLKRKSGRPSSTGSALKLSQGRASRRPKTAQNRVSFADGNTKDTSSHAEEISSKLDSSVTSVAAGTLTISTCCMGTNTNDLSTSLSEVSNSPIKRFHEENENDAPFSSTRSSGTSTDDLLTQDNQSSCNNKGLYSANR